jgi:hypothetical protein
MKEKDGYIDFPQQQVILYVEKEDGKYGPIQTGSGISKNYLDDYELKRLHLEESLRNKVINGEISMVKYYMVLEDLTISELAARVRIRKSSVKKHLDPVLFGKIRLDELKKYAEVFNVPLAHMVQVLMLLKGDKPESYTIAEEMNQAEGIEFENTRNPYAGLTKIGEKKK